MSIFRNIAALFVLCAAASHVQAAPEPHVKASLIADVSGIHAAKAFTIGVLLEIDPGWHIYWSNPGDSGLATSVKFKAPDGFTVTPDPFPVPRRFQQAANERVYGYENAVLITARVIPPADLPIGQEVAFEADVRWLVCKQECVPGKAAPSLSIKISDHAGPANVMPFDRYRSIVTPAKEHSPDVAEVKSTFDPATQTATIEVHWKNPATGIDLFPGADDALTISHVSLKKTENEVTPITLKIETAKGQTPGERLLVLISYHDSAGRLRGFETMVPVK
jgi:DsbC/DsbD-like thiol-disulfide interchange protein